MKQLFIGLIVMFYGVSSINAQSWEILESTTGYILFDISIPPGQSNVIYAAGMQYTYDAEGVIIKSIDGGDSWQQIVGGVNTLGFEAICFTSPEVGYVAGWDGYFAKTTDGGSSWNSIPVGSGNWFFMDIEFFDTNNGVALANLNSGSSGVYITSDAGENWVAALGINHNVQDLSYADANTVFAVGGDEKISKSINGGVAFSEIYSGTFQRYFMGCDFHNDFGVIGGEDGKIFSTNDGGDTWNTFATGYHNFQGVHVFDADSAYIAGTDADVYKTTDWGENWVVEDNGAESSHIYKVKFADDGTGFLCGSQGMIKRKVAALSASFEANETDICDGDEVQFTDLSSGNIETWSWAFEGGYPSNSVEANPIIYYADGGTYDVSLTIFDGTIENTIVMEDYITVHNCSGLIENDHMDVQLIPNPAQNFIQISGINTESIIVKIFNLQAKQILEIQIKGQQLDVSNLQTGIYILQFENESQELIRKKLIVK